MRNVHIDISVALCQSGEISRKIDGPFLFENKFRQTLDKPSTDLTMATVMVKMYKHYKENTKLYLVYAIYNTLPLFGSISSI